MKKTQLDKAKILGLCLTVCTQINKQYCLGMFNRQLSVPKDFDVALPEDVAMQFQSGTIELSSENR